MDENIKKRLLQNVQAASKKQQSGVGSSINDVMYRFGKVLGVTTRYTVGLLGLIITFSVMFFLVWPLIFVSILFVFFLAGMLIESVFNLGEETASSVLALIGGGIGFSVGMAVMIEVIGDKWEKLKHNKII